MTTVSQILKNWEREEKNQSDHPVVDKANQISVLGVDDKIYTSCSPTN